jgi:phage gpG-like protein
MTMVVKLEGSKALKSALAGMSDKIAVEVNKAVIGTALQLQGEIKDSIQHGPASGRTYRRRGVMHRASAPGQAPMSDTGRLAGSIYFDTDGPMRAVVGSFLVYAKYLEYGTTRMNFSGGVGGPRPFFRPAVEAMRPRFEKYISDALAGVVR